MKRVQYKYGGALTGLDSLRVSAVSKHLQYFNMSSRILQSSASSWILRGLRLSYIAAAVLSAMDGSEP